MKEQIMIFLAIVFIGVWISIEIGNIVDELKKINTFLEENKKQ